MVTTAGRGTAAGLPGLHAAELSGCHFPDSQGMTCADSWFLLLTEIFLIFRPKFAFTLHKLGIILFLLR